jgi:branched-chain amino acid aminotransferase
VAITYHRTDFVDDADATISIRAKAFNYGLGCFGGVRAYWDEKQQELFVFRLEDHVQRLLESAHILGLEPAVAGDEVARVILELLRRNDAREDHYVRPLFFVDSDELSPTLTDVPVSFSVYCLPLGRYFKSESIDLCVSSWRRVGDNAIPARAKPTGAYLNSALARAEAKKNGYDDAIVLTESGEVSEASAAHLLMVRRGELVSPPSTADNLEGITRRSILELAAAAPLNLPVVERTISRTELYVADEVFLSGTAAEVTPVASIDRRRIGSGKVGPVTATIAERFRNIARGGDAAFASWLTPVWGDARRRTAVA